MPTERTKLSVIIATYNGGTSIGRCLDSLTRQTVPDDSYEVIVVDNNSADDTARVVSEYVKTHENFSLLSEPEQGVGHARNRGIAAARGDYVCFIDDDAYADTRWLEGVLTAFETIEPPPAVVGGKILPYYTTDKPAWFDDALETRSSGARPRFLLSKECQFGFSESNLCIRKAVLDRTGGFATDLGPRGDRMMFGEGIDLSRRIARDDPRFWYDPGIVVYHYVPKRNMSVRYILSRKFRTAYVYQAAESRDAGALRNALTLLICAARTGMHLLLSVLLVRWFTKKAVADWLRQFIPAINCFSRSLCLIRRGFRSTLFRK